MKLIDKIFEQGQKAIDAIKRPFVVDKLKRAFDSAVSSAEEKKVDKEIEIQKLRLKFVEEPENAESTLNSIIKAREDIRKADRTIDITNEERKLLFEEEVEE